MWSPQFTMLNRAKNVGGLAGGGQHGRCAALQRGDLGGHIVIGGGSGDGCRNSRWPPGQKLAHVLAGRVLEGGGLDNRDLPGLAVAGGVASLDTGGFDAIAHGCVLLSGLERKTAFVPKNLSLRRKPIKTSAVPLKLRRPHGPAPLMGSNKPLCSRRGIHGDGPTGRNTAHRTPAVRSHRTWRPLPPAHTARRLSEGAGLRPSPSSLWKIL